MTNDQIIMALTILATTIVISAAMLRGWQGWLALKGRELDARPREIEGGALPSMSRIELADLRERIRKLEAIAAGVDL